MLESSDLHKMSEKLTTLNEIHEEINSISITENIIHTNDEWMIDFVKNLFFELKGVHRLVLNDDILSNTFHSINFLGPDVHNLKNFSKSTLSYNF